VIKYGVGALQRHEVHSALRKMIGVTLRRTYKTEYAETGENAGVTKAKLSAYHEGRN
jgi:hypothetical protein